MKLKTYDEIRKQHLENINDGISHTTSAFMIYQQGRLEGMVTPLVGGECAPCAHKTKPCDDRQCDCPNSHSPDCEMITLGAPVCTCGAAEIEESKTSIE